MTLTVDVALEEERTARKEAAIRKFAELTTNGELEILRLEKQIQKIRDSNSNVPDFNDPLAVSEFMNRHGYM